MLGCAPPPHWINAHVRVGPMPPASFVDLSAMHATHHHCSIRIGSAARQLYRSPPPSALRTGVFSLLLGIAYRSQSFIAVCHPSAPAQPHACRAKSFDNFDSLDRGDISPACTRGDLPCSPILKMPSGRTHTIPCCDTQRFASTCTHWSAQCHR